MENALTILPLADAFGQLLAKLVGLAGVGVLVDKSIQVGPYEVRLEKREVIVVEGFLWGVDEAAFVDELLLPMSGWDFAVQPHRVVRNDLGVPDFELRRVVSVVYVDGLVAAKLASVVVVVLFRHSCRNRRGTSEKY